MHIGGVRTGSWSGSVETWFGPGRRSPFRYDVVAMVAPASTRSSPPVGVKLRYHLFSLRVPEEWRRWAEEDIWSPSWPIRESLRAAFPLAAFFVFLQLIRGLRDAFTEGLGEGAVEAIDALPGALLFVFALAYVTLARIIRDLDGSRAKALRYQRGEGLHPWRSAYGSGFEAPPLRTILGWVLGGLLIGGLISLAIIVFLV